METFKPIEHLRPLQGDDEQISRQTLEEHHRLLMEFIENRNSLISIKDKEGRYQLVNQQWEEVMGLSREWVIGKSDAELFPENIARNFQDNDRCNGKWQCDGRGRED